MHIVPFQTLCSLYFLLQLIPSTYAHNGRHPNQVRDIFSPIESLANSIFGITTAGSTQQTAAASTTPQPATTTQDDPTTSSSPQVVTVVPTVASTTASSSSETAPTSTTSESVTSASITSISDTVTTASSATTTASSSITLLAPSPTTTPPANPVQGLPSSSTDAPQNNAHNGNSVSGAGIAVAVIFSLLIFAGLAYLFYKQFHDVKEKISLRREGNSEGVKPRFPLDLDEEKGFARDRGLGLEPITKLEYERHASWSQTDQDFKTRPRAASEDTLGADPTLPMSPLDRKDSPLPPTPQTYQPKWPLVSPVEAPIPASHTISRKPVGGYLPYKRQTQIGIGLAVPLSKVKVQAPQRLQTRPAELEETEVRRKSRGGRRISGMHELS